MLRLVGGGALLMALFAAACGGSSERATPSETPVAATATAEPTRAASTGIASVDAIIAAVATGDADAVERLFRYTPTACTKQQEGIGAPPLCRDGEADGTLVDVLPMAQCEGFFARPDEIDVNRLPLADSPLYAVYRTSPGFWPPGAYAIIFDGSHPELAVQAWEIVASDDGITGINFGCSQTPPQMVQFQGLTDVVLAPPPETATPSASATAAPR